MIFQTEVLYWDRKNTFRLEITIVSECCAFYCLRRSIPCFRSLRSLNSDAWQIVKLALSLLTTGEQRCDLNVLLLPITNHSDAISKAADRSYFAKLLKTD